MALKYLICNLKAHKTYYEMSLYKDTLKTITSNNTQLILAPSTAYLSLFKNENITLCSQDININNDLYLTGDTSIETLKSLDVKYTIIGHFERRKYYNENYNIILKKINLALEQDLNVIYCIGETREEYLRKVKHQVLERDIARILNNIPEDKFNKIIIAYEPTYLIGSNEPYDLEEIESTIKFIKRLIESYYHHKINIIFGGNVNEENIKDLTNIIELDGYILGNSCLNPLKIKNIIDIIETKC